MDEAANRTTYRLEKRTASVDTKQLLAKRPARHNVAGESVRGILCMETETGPTRP